MLLYRLYFMNPVSGHIDRFLDFAAENNVTAIVAAHEHQGDAPLELWCGHKKICRIAPVASRPSVTPRSSTKDEGEP